MGRSVDRTTFPCVLCAQARSFHCAGSGLLTLTTNPTNGCGEGKKLGLITIEKMGMGKVGPPCSLLFGGSVMAYAQNYSPSPTISPERKNLCVPDGALFTGKFDVITKPILSLQPPWTTVFSKEKVKLTCEQLNLTGLSDIIWYRNGEKFYQSSRNSIVIWKSGQYSCGSQGYAPSDPVAITFSNDWLILQVPYSVFEGDAVILQCQGWKKAKLSQVTFHKERKFIHFTKENNSLPIKSARIEHSGLYSCSGYVNHQKNNQSSTPAILQVQETMAQFPQHFYLLTPRTSSIHQFSLTLKSTLPPELFPPPELRIKNSTETMEGNLMALSCETQLPLQRSSSQLYFSFFKDNKTIRDRDQSPEYCIPGTIIGDAGLYWCEAATEDGQVKKQSLGLEIQVPRGSRNSQLVLQITLTLLGVTGISTVLLFCFRFMKKSGELGSSRIVYVTTMSEVFSNCFSYIAPLGSPHTLYILNTVDQESLPDLILPCPCLAH
ncbi:Fc receptor-like protein 6 [Monodelphis domestica]|uniref:Fc receptor-like protein 6 n=1 Tax=Monodelphis domestica TaxID=13616 RepID=UPI0024E1CBEC|nr:Fc receptor-like protein 6 [Monodelphis domestica]